MRPIRARLAITVAVFGALLLVALVVAPVVGSTSISLPRVFDRSIPFADNLDAQIFFIARLPRVVAATLVGASLAAAGVVFQALLRNPLAPPDTLRRPERRRTRRDVRAHFHLDFKIAGLPAILWPALPDRSSRSCGRHALATGRRRGFDHGPAPRRRDDDRVPVGADDVHAALANFTDTFRTVRWLMGCRRAATNRS